MKDVFGLRPCPSSVGRERGKGDREGREGGWLNSMRGTTRRSSSELEREPARDSLPPVACNPRLLDPSPTLKQTQTIFVRGTAN